MSTISVKGKPLWYTLYLVLLVSVLFGAMEKIIDNYIVSSIISADKVGNDVMAALSYLVAGSVIGTPLSILFALLFGRILKPGFKRIEFKNRVMHKQAAWAGILGAFFTFFILWGNQYGDPGMVSALSSIVILIAIIIDWRKKRIKLDQAIVPGLLVLCGSLIAASYKIALGWQSILLVGVIAVLFRAKMEFSEQDGSIAADEVSMFVWRWIWLTGVSVVGSFIYALATGNLNMLINGIFLAKSALPWILLLIFSVFVGMVMKFKAKIKTTVTEVLLILAFIPVAVFVFNLITRVSLSWFTLFRSPSSIEEWLLRVGGAILIAIGTVLYVLKKPKTRNLVN